MLKISFKMQYNNFYVVKNHNKIYIKINKKRIINQSLMPNGKLFMIN